MITLVGERLTGVREDVRFYFVEAQGEMGVRSAWNVPENPYRGSLRHDPVRVATAKAGGTTVDAGLRCGPVFCGAPQRSPRVYELQGVGAAQRYARIEAAMRRLDGRTREILRGAYADDRPLLVREVFAECALLAEFTHTALMAHRRARSTLPVGTWLDALCQRVSKARRSLKAAPAGDWAVVEEIRVDATRELVWAEREYLRAKGVRHGR